VTALKLLAENNFGDTRSGSLAGPMGLFIVVMLAIGTVLLIRNMNSRLRRLPDRFPSQGGSEGQGGAGSQGGVGSQGGSASDRDDAARPDSSGAE
jgi:hypothetical protein